MNTSHILVTSIALTILNAANKVFKVSAVFWLSDLFKIPGWVFITSQLEGLADLVFIKKYIYSLGMLFFFFPEIPLPL